MPILTISHVTSYAYRQPVNFGDHRIFVRPRESHDQNLIESRLVIEPEPSEIRWLHDVFGNSVAIASFRRRSTTLKFDSFVRMEHKPMLAEDVEVEPYARLFPFSYAPEDMPDLLRSIERQHHDPDRVLDKWARRFLRKDTETQTIDMLGDMTRSIKRNFTYLSRAEKGTQTPVETIQRRQGTCRDFAVLMMEAARALGLAAWFVSGYLYNPRGTSGRVGGGSTHAWVRIFLPGSGWVEFDPTNGIVGSAGLVKVAVARDPYQAVPISGTWSGFPGSELPMDVSVEVHLEDAQNDAPATKVAASGNR